MKKRDFYKIEVTPIINCQNGCKYCAKDKSLSHYNSTKSEMTLDDFKRYISNVPKPTHIFFAGHGDSMKAVDMPDIVKYLHEDGDRTTYIFTTLHQVSKASIRKTFSIPNLFVRFHFPDANGYTNIKLTQELVKNYELAIRLLKLNNSRFSICCWGDIPSELKHLCTNDVLVETDLRQLGDFAGNINMEWFTPTNYVNSKVKCERQFCPHLVPDGRLCLCMEDWSFQHVIGDLNTQTYLDIFNGDRYSEILRAREECGSNILCKHCSDAKIVKE